MKNRILFLLIIVLAFLVRFINLDKTPPSLYWDEASLGYNAYTISQKGVDEHGNFLPVVFEAFGDYKPPGYIYLDAVFIKFLGLNEIAVRLPSVLAGVGLVGVSFFLAREYFPALPLVPWIAMLLVAFSPWTILLSRGAFEANLATFFSGLGLLLFKRKIFILSAIFFALAIYTFNSHRVFIPLALIFLVLFNFQKRILVFCLVGAILCLPLLPHLFSKEGGLRFQEVTWLNNLSLIEEANNLKINRRIIYAREFLYHLGDNFSLDYLLYRGDVNTRVSTRNEGILFPLDILFIPLGLIFLWKNSKKTFLELLVLGFLALVPASMARETPHALRTFNIVPIPQIIAAVGIFYLINKRKILIGIIFALYLFWFMRFSLNYFNNYSLQYSSDWQYGYKEMITEVNKIKNNYDFVSVTNFYGRPYIYFLFYNQYPISDYLKSRSVTKDQFGFWKVLSFNKYYFEGSSLPKGRGLFVRAPYDKINKIPLKTIYDIKGDEAFYLYD